MNLLPSTQTKLYKLEKYLNRFIYLLENNTFPNKILLSGQKGIGKSTLAYHLINFVLSKEEDFSYDKEKFEISRNNKSFTLIKNNSNPNFYLIDLKSEKKNIDITQIRELLIYANKSSFNNKNRFVLVDNIEFLNVNSINALLKVLEEPNLGLYFILINNNKKILPTLKSRCLDFKINLSYSDAIFVANQLLELDVNEFINKELFNYYQSPANLIDLYKFSKNYDVNLSNTSLGSFLDIMIKEKFYKKESSFRKIIFDYIQLYFQKEIIKSNYKLINYYHYFVKMIGDTEKFNLDEDNFFLEFRSKILNG